MPNKFWTNGHLQTPHHSSKINGNVGIEDEKVSEFGISLYPAPANDFCTLSWPHWQNGSKLQLLNMAGQMLLEKPITDNATQIDLTTLAAGIYFVRIIADDKVLTTQKIIRQN